MIAFHDREVAAATTARDRERLGLLKSRDTESRDAAHARSGQLIAKYRDSGIIADWPLLSLAYTINAETAATPADSIAVYDEMHRIFLQKSAVRADYLNDALKALDAKASLTTSPVEKLATYSAIISLGRSPDYNRAGLLTEKAVADKVKLLRSLRDK